MARIFSLFINPRRRISAAGLCLPLLFALASKSFALDPAKSVYQYSCRSWARQNGLPANGVNAVLQTDDGYIWLGTAMGLVRFDGSDFKLFDMTQVPGVRSTIVTSLAKSQRGGLWFGLGHGAFGFCDGDKISFSGKDEWGGPGLNVHSVLETDGDLWIAAETQLARISRSNSYTAMMTGSAITDRYDVTALYQGSKGRVWIGTSRRGLHYWINGTTFKFPDTALDDLIIRSIIEDRTGRIWVGTHVGLFCYDSNFRKIDEALNFSETPVLLEDRNGIVWAGTSGNGLTRFQNGESTAFRHTNGLADDFVTSITEDREGSLWVGTRNGLSQLSDVKIPTFGKTEGLPSDVNLGVCASRRGGLWVASSDGYMYFDGKNVEAYYSTNVGIANNYVKCLYEAKNGDLYLGNGNMEIEIVSGGKVVGRYPNKLWPMAITEDSQGVVVACGGELFRAGPTRYQPYRFANDQKPSLGWVFNMAAGADGSFWVAGDNGVCQVKGDTFRMWTRENGLPNSKATWIYEDKDGTVWVGLEMGLVRLKDGKIRHMTRENGLFDNMIYSVVPDDHGSLWIDSSRGIFRVSLRNLNEFADGIADRIQCAAYDGLDAVKTDEKFQYMQSGCKTLNGRIWFPTVQGVVMIDPTNITANLIAPEVHIQSVHANGRELDRAGDSIVPPGKGELEIHYAGLSYIAPQKVQYRYKLEGYDKEWIDVGGRRSAFYTNLKPGKYRFYVQACNGDGIWNSAGASHGVELQPHFYQTAWFLGLIGTLVAGSLFGIVALRIQHFKTKQRNLQEAHDLLETKVTARTAELAESNISLKNEIEERKRMESEVERVHRQLMDASRQAGQAEVASSILHNVGNVLNSVNVSATIICERLRKMRLGNLSKAAQLMEEQGNNLGRFLTEDERGQQLPGYLSELAKNLTSEQSVVLDEVKDLAEHIEHIKEIVNMQQAYARVAGVMELMPVTELVENALKMHAGAYTRHSVSVIRDFQDVPAITVDKHKVLQILVNLFHNAKYACDESNLSYKQVTVRIRNSEKQSVRIEVADNGVGILPENLTRIFSHGFTTRKNGHGFGLHSAGLAAKELGGTLVAQSEGSGKGATFVLELPVKREGKEGAPARGTIVTAV